MYKIADQNSIPLSEAPKETEQSMTSTFSDPEQEFLDILVKINLLINTYGEPDEVIGSDGRQALSTLKELLQEFDSKEPNVAVYGLVVSQTKLLCNIVEPKLSGLFWMFSYTNTKEFIAKLKLLADGANVLLPAVTTHIIAKAKKAWETKNNKEEKKEEVDIQQHIDEVVDRRLVHYVTADLLEQKLQTERGRHETTLKAMQESHAQTLAITRQFESLEGILSISSSSSNQITRQKQDSVMALCTIIRDLNERIIRLEDELVRTQKQGQPISSAQNNSPHSSRQEISRAQRYIPAERLRLLKAYSAILKANTELYKKYTRAIDLFLVHILRHLEENDLAQFVQQAQQASKVFQWALQENNISQEDKQFVAILHEWASGRVKENYQQHVDALIEHLRVDRNSDDLNVLIKLTIIENLQKVMDDESEQLQWSDFVAEQIAAYKQQLELIDEKEEDAEATPSKK